MKQNSKQSSFVLKGDICYSKSQTELFTLAGGFLVCEGGVSRGVFARLPEEYAGLPLVDCSGSLVIPGLVDLHVHAPQYSFRGLGMDLELLDWLNTHTFPEEAKYADAAYGDKAYAAFVEDVKRGPNTRACVFATAHVPATLLLMEKLEESGLVTMVGKVNMDRNSHPDLQEKSAAQSADDTRLWLRELAGRFENTTPILTPRFIPSCTDELMGLLRTIQGESGLPVQSHLSENQGEIAWVKELCPEADFYGDAYDRFGLFGKGVPTVMAHCVWSNEAEAERMRENGVFVAHCPQSNTNLASGIAPIRQYLQKGLPVGLGSDVAGGCHTSIFRAMSDAIQMSKLRWRLVDQQDAPLTVAEAFWLGTVGGGRFFGKVGSFDEGYELDAVVIDDAPLAAPYPLDIPDRLARAIYLGSNHNIVQKYARGGRVL